MFFLRFYYFINVLRYLKEQYSPGTGAVIHSQKVMKFALKSTPQPKLKELKTIRLTPTEDCAIYVSMQGNFKTIFVGGYTTIQFIFCLFYRFPVMKICVAKTLEHILKPFFIKYFFSKVVLGHM